MPAARAPFNRSKPRRERQQQTLEVRVVPERDLRVAGEELDIALVHRLQPAEVRDAELDDAESEACARFDRAEHRHRLVVARVAVDVDLGAAEPESELAIERPTEVLRVHDLDLGRDL